MSPLKAPAQQLAAAVLAVALAPLAWVAALAAPAYGAEPAPASTELKLAESPADSAAAAAAATAASEQPLAPGATRSSQPLLVFADIERSWGRGEAESLLVHFGAGKVSLSFTRSGPRGGLYTRTQAGYLLADMFKYSKTEQFKFVKFRNIERDGQLPFAVADRIYRLDNGVLYHDQVYVSLRREGDAWKVGEIKSIEH